MHTTSGLPAIRRHQGNSRHSEVAPCLSARALTVSLIAPVLAILVIDADTVEQDGVRYRLMGLDAPEIGQAKCPAERHAGIEAAARLLQLIGERGAELEPAGKRRDKFGRGLVRWMVGSKDWAEIAIGEGHAKT
jgi:micrococcal nuclease